MRKLLTIILVISTALNSFSQKHKTEFKPSDFKFENGKLMYYVVYKGDTVGEFWDVYDAKMVTNQTHPEFFRGNMSMEDMHKRVKGMAITPDGMTTGSTPVLMQGKSLADGIPVGDGIPRDYGIIVAGRGLTFTHYNEIPDFDNQYDKIKKNKGTMFFLPVVYNKGKTIPNSIGRVDRVLINRLTPSNNSVPLAGKQQGIIIFYEKYSYPKVIDIVLGLNRNYKDGSVKSRTKHIFVLDGGPNYGAVSKRNASGKVVVTGTRDPGVNTNYLFC